MQVFFTHSKNIKPYRINDSGIYKIQYKCGKKYVGKTGGKISEKTKEHFTNATHKKIGKSSLSDRLIETGHKPGECTTKV